MTTTADVKFSGSDYYRVDYQDRLPPDEVQRRQLIKERLETQFKQWEEQEQYRQYPLSLMNLLPKANRRPCSHQLPTSLARGHQQ